jgi:hypothetical protein
MLFRGDTPLTPKERLVYEYECELERMREAGLVMETADASGESVWTATLKGAREMGFGNTHPDRVRRA